MILHPRRMSSRRFAGLAVLAPAALALVLFTSCDPDILIIKVDTGTVGIDARFHDAPGELAAPDDARGKVGHPWFPLTPGRYTDFLIRRYPSTDVTYIRATMGEPEEFFGRMATPWVYGPVPGLPVDESLEDLRQYYSVDADGALRMHGSENKGIMSYMEPPIRHLLPEPVPQSTWIDTTFFRSYFPGMVPIFAGAQTYTSTLSERSFLDLPGRPAHAMRRGQVIDEYEGPVGSAAAAASFAELDGAALAAALLAGESPGVALEGARGRRDRPALDPLKGIWFARGQGFVARDYPHGPGTTNINITTYERIDSGFGPVPPAQTTP